MVSGRQSNQQISDHDPLSDLGNFRMTPQRRHVYEAIMSRQDHPSASEVFDQVKDTMPHISLATIYNCLEAMTQNGVIKQVNFDREPSRYCGNLDDHAHFLCQECGSVSDVPLAADNLLGEAILLPNGAHATQLEISVRGTCAQCATAAAPSGDEPSLSPQTPHQN